ncbi:hypothetical protein GCM10018955_22750 [Planomonospora venezuelensis]
METVATDTPASSAMSEILTRSFVTCSPFVWVGAYIEIFAANQPTSSDAYVIDL